MNRHWLILVKPIAFIIMTAITVTQLASCTKREIGETLDITGEILEQIGEALEQE